MEARYDPIVQRHVPAPGLVHRAFNMLLDRETEQERLVRQHWDAAFGAVKVAMDSLREVWPVDAADVGGNVSSALSEALRLTEDAYAALDGIALEMVGPLLVLVHRGHIKTEEQFDAYLDAQADD